jgi:hypothetical protein
MRGCARVAAFSSFAASAATRVCLAAYSASLLRLPHFYCFFVFVLMFSILFFFVNSCGCSACPFLCTTPSLTVALFSGGLDVPGFVPGYDSLHEPMNNTSPLFIALAALLFAAKWLYGFGNLAVAQVSR